MPIDEVDWQCERRPAVLADQRFRFGNLAASPCHNCDRGTGFGEMTGDFAAYASARTCHQAHGSIQLVQESLLVPIGIRATPVRSVPEWTYGVSAGIQRVNL